MTLAGDVVQTAVAVGVSNTQEGLKAIHSPGCAAAVWEREPLLAFQPWLQALDPAKLPKARMILTPDKVRTALEETAFICGTPDCEECAMLMDDIAALALIFADVMRAPYLRLRLDVINTNACRKFHIDRVTARLLCTYRGTGTQYGMSTDGEAPEQVFTVPPCAPIIIRGTEWPGEPKTGLLHRSPPIESTGETRLLLVLDPVLDNDPEMHHEGPTLH